MAGRLTGRGNGFRHGVLGLTCLALVISTLDATAQNLGAQRFVPASSEDGVLGTEGAGRRIPLHPYVALWMTYGLNPLILLDEEEDEVGAVVSDLFAFDLTFSINVWKGLDLGANLPVALVSEGDDLDGSLGLSTGGGIGDLELRIGYRFPITPTSGLGLHVPFLLPTAGDDDPLWLGFGIKPTLAYMHGFSRLDLLLNLSILLRESQDLLDYEGGSELGLRAGLRIALDRQWDTSILVDLGLTTPFADAFSAAATPLEPRLGLEHWVDDNWRLTLFLGFGLTGGVGAPDFRLGLGASYGRQPNRGGVEGDRDGDGYSDDPESARDRDGDGRDDGDDGRDNDGDGQVDEEDEGAHEGNDGRDNDGDGQVDEEDEGGEREDPGEDGRDNDGDGEVDEEDERRGDRGRVDECPDEPEDFDGFEDEDGCPDEDNDGDGIDDEDDACPNEPETHDGIADDDGCPDRVRVEGTLITTFEPIRFQTDSDELLPESYPILHEVGNVMEANPGMDIRVEGHTDSAGDDAHNMTLSQQRAESVRRYLIEREGIDPDRLVAEGHGETRPVATNGTEEGRAQNRRVEFHILE